MLLAYLVLGGLGALIGARLGYAGGVALAYYGMGWYLRRPQAADA